MEKTRKNRKISLAEVASAAGVSKMTASRVLRDQGGFSSHTRQRIPVEVERLVSDLGIDANVDRIE